METARARRLVVLETVGSLFWFLMDGCWMLGLGGLARALALPTVATQLVAFRYVLAAVRARSAGEVLKQALGRFRRLRRPTR